MTKDFTAKELAQLVKDGLKIIELLEAELAKKPAKFMIKLIGEHNEETTIFAESSNDLTDYMNHQELINKIILEDDDCSEKDFEYYLSYGKIKVSKMTYDEIFINADKLEGKNG